MILADREYPNALEMIAAVLSRPKLAKGTMLCASSHELRDVAIAGYDPGAQGRIAGATIHARMLRVLLDKLNRVDQPFACRRRRAMPTPRSARVDPRSASVVGSGTAM